jgi:hypothetical protein
VAWYERLLGAPPSFLPNDTEAVWELADHWYVFIEVRPAHAGHATHHRLRRQLRRPHLPDRREERFAARMSWMTMKSCSLTSGGWATWSKMAESWAEFQHWTSLCLAPLTLSAWAFVPVTATRATSKRYSDSGKVNFFKVLASFAASDQPASFSQTVLHGLG